jgi:hypothetical protein
MDREGRSLDYFGIFAQLIYRAYDLGIADSSNSYLFSMSVIITSYSEIDADTKRV